MEADGNPYNLFFYTSPYKRSRQTFEEIGKAIDPEAVIGAQEEVQLREQDFGNFQARTSAVPPRPSSNNRVRSQPLCLLLFISASKGLCL